VRTRIGSRRRLPLAAVILAIAAAAVVLPRPAPARADGFQCLPAPSGWTLDAVAPKQDTSPPSPGETHPQVHLWSAACVYAETKVSIHVRPGLEEGGTAEAQVWWADVPGPCPLPAFDFGSFGEAKTVSGELHGNSTRSVATYSWTPQADPFHGGMKDLAATMLAAAEARAADCTSGGGADAGPGGGSSGGFPDHSLEIAGGLILLLLGGGGLLFSGAGGGTGLLTRGGTSGQDTTQQQRSPQPPVVTITAPGQGDEVGEYVTVTGTVTGAISVFATAPGGGATGPAVGGTFSVTTRVGVRHAAIVVEAVNADGTGRAAVHVFRPDGPEWLPGDDEDHTNALLAQKDAQQAAELTRYQQAAAPHPQPTAIVPKSYDELMGRLSNPKGGAVGISGKDAPNLLPPGSEWMRTFISGVSVDGQVVTVKTPIGSGSGSLWLNDKGQIVFDPTTVGHGQDMLPDDVSKKVQARLDDITDRLHRAGVRLTEVRIDAGRIWITTGPR
jgi:hypothetical protein